ncbi:MAG: hypothetical protein P1U68_08030 [Verrucomicrobiales bacterium]|nr:hypothetical protein [Verrucomicrobiales bacterium]
MKGSFVLVVPGTLATTTFTVSLANEGCGYPPPPHQRKLCSYETWPGTSRFEENASVIPVEQLLEMPAELKSL